MCLANILTWTSADELISTTVYQKLHILTYCGILTSCSLQPNEASMLAKPTPGYNKLGFILVFLLFLTHMLPPTFILIEIPLITFFGLLTIVFLTPPIVLKGLRGLWRVGGTLAVIYSVALLTWKLGLFILAIINVLTGNTHETGSGLC